MAHVRLFSDDEADAPLRRELDAARKRAGRVWNIVRVMGHNPAALHAAMALYSVVMHGPSPLSRAQREMMAVVVSQANDCFY
ncbi:MAG: carboxymuconolactone decarboxylase family protein [Planctomycetota bacterium]